MMNEAGFWPAFTPDTSFDLRTTDRRSLVHFDHFFVYASILNPPSKILISLP
jgi:hypothetical protein